MKVVNYTVPADKTIVREPVLSVEEFKRLL